MAYETKALLVAIAMIVRKSGSLQELYEALQEIANTEGVILKPFTSDKYSESDSE